MTLTALEIQIPPKRKLSYKEEGGPNTYHLRDLGLSWSAITEQKTAHGQYEVPASTWMVMNRVMGLMKDNYFKVGPDEFTEQHGKSYEKATGYKYREDPARRGGRFYMPIAGMFNGLPVNGSLEFKAECNPGTPSFRIEFFSECGCEPGRGRWDSKITTMPYLMRLKVRSILTKITRLLSDEFGATSGDRPTGKTMDEDVLIDREYSWHRDSYGKMRGCYGQGKTTKDGVPITDGMPVYYTGYGYGRVLRGRAWDNLDEMVKVTSPGIQEKYPYQLHYSHCWAEFPGTRRWFTHDTRVKKLKKFIGVCVKREDYLRAYKAKQALDRIIGGNEAK